MLKVKWSVENIDTKEKINEGEAEGGRAYEELAYCWHVMAGYGSSRYYKRVTEYLYLPTGGRAFNFYYKDSGPRLRFTYRFEGIHD